MSPVFLMQVNALVPEIFLALFAVILLMLGVFGGNRLTQVINVTAIVILVAALSLLYGVPGQPPSELMAGTPPTAPDPLRALFLTGTFDAFGKLLVLLSAVFALIMSHVWLEDEKNQRFEYAILVLFSVLGMMLMLSANDLLTVYLGIELAALTQYILAAFDRDNQRSSEAGIKYFVLGSLASGMLLFGISLIYGFVGTTNFSGIAEMIRTMMHPEEGVVISAAAPYGILLGLVMVIVGFCFKISAAPFHMWSPDVYEGSPTPVTAFFTLAPKISAVLLFVRLLAGPFAELMEYWQPILIAISVLSMLVGALGAITQTNIKRLLAYSSIGHVGYALIGIAAGGEGGVGAVLVYLALYIFMSAGSFGCLLLMRRQGVYLENIRDLAGISRHHRYFAFAMAAFMFSMAGIPPLAGFFGKLQVFLAAVDTGLIALAVIGVLTSVIGAYYYLKIVKIMYFDEGGEAYDGGQSLSLRVLVGACAVFQLAFLFQPSLLITPAMMAAQALLL